MKAVLLVALGGGLGSALRYQIGLWTLRSSELVRFPIGTLLINVVGCFLVGLLWVWVERSNAWSGELRLALMVGFLGGFTTFSAFGLETFLILKRGAAGTALTYAGLSLVFGCLAVWLGYLLGGGRG